VGTAPRHPWDEADCQGTKGAPKLSSLGHLRYPNEYEQRYAAELARAHTEVQDEEPDDQQPVRPAVRVPYWQQRNPTAEQHAHATAQRRALLWLAKLYPDTTTQLYQAQAARLPLNPADRTPTRRRALAWAAALDRLRRLHPRRLLCPLQDRAGMCQTPPWQ
jgi:hypothetical protein